MEYSDRYKNSYQLFERATQVIPGGIPSPRTPYFLTFGKQPVFIDRAEGARLWDVDGHEYIDYMCAYGAVFLGYQHPVVEKAVQEQAKKSNCTSLPSRKWVELAEFLVQDIPMADWCVFAKNGSDVTSHAAMVARAHTEKPGIARAHHAYHGVHHWCVESTVGIPPEYKEHNYFFNYNDIEDMEEVVEKNKDRLAALFLTPVGHWALKDQEEPAPAFLEKARELCDKHGILLAIDDIRCGFRIKYEGTHAYYSNIEPDLLCFGKAIGNGHPLAVSLGKKEYFESAKRLYFSGTHFYSAEPLAAALACLNEIKTSGAIEKVHKLGTRLMEGLREAGKNHGFNVSVTGHPAMPYMTFENDDNREKNREFCAEAAIRGIFFHPHHNWFVSAALNEEDIEKTIEASDGSFKAMKENQGA